MLLNGKTKMQIIFIKDIYKRTLLHDANFILGIKSTKINYCNVPQESDKEFCRFRSKLELVMEELDVDEPAL